MIADLTFANGLSRARKRALLVTADFALMSAALPAALLLRGVSLQAMADPRVLAVLLLPVPVALVIFWRLGLYLAVLRYITGKAMPIVMAGTLGAGLLMFGGLVAFAPDLPPELAAIHAMLALLGVSGMRFGLRRLLHRSGEGHRAPVLIYGAGGAGQQLVAALHLGHEYRPIAFVDDDVALQGSTVSGVRVHSPADMATLARRWNIREVMLALPNISRARRRLIVSQIERLGVEVKTIASLNDVVAGRARFSDLRQVTPTDLLGRDPVPPNPDLMERNIAGKVVLVTGAGGSIGSELCRQIVRHKPAALVMLDVSEFALYTINTELRDKLGAEAPRLYAILGSVQNPNRMRAILRRFQVQTVYHAAAYKHVVLVEENIIEGLHNNIFGTRVIAEAAVETGVETFILVSTDKTVRPSNVMGASKRVAELICQALDRDSKTTFCMVRFGNVMESSGSVIPRFREQIEHNGPVTVTHREVERFFMTIPEAAQLVIQAGAMAKGGDVFVLDMGQPVRILDLARSMIRLHGFVPYVIDESGHAEEPAGDIAIRITGLGKGEKLYEELLIGNNPSGTEHPRIMTASEKAMTPAELKGLLDDLWAACKDFDLARIQHLLIEAPLDYRPNDTVIHDLMWPAESDRTRTAPALRLVEGNAARGTPG